MAHDGTLMTYKTLIQRVYVIQKTAIRRIFGVNYLTHSYSLFGQLNILQLTSLFYFKVLNIFFHQIGMFSTINGVHPHLRLFTRSLLNYNRVWTTWFNCCYSNISIRLFNNLLASIKFVRSLSWFCLRGFLISILIILIVFLIILYHSLYHPYFFLFIFIGIKYISSEFSL